MSAKRVKRSSVQRPGVSLELVVARIQQMMEPNSKVTHDEWIVDRFGIKRHFDVTVRGKFAGRDILGVIPQGIHEEGSGTWKKGGSRLSLAFAGARRASWI